MSKVPTTKKAKRIYSNIHHWLRYNHGKASMCENEFCLRINNSFQWALLREKNYEYKRENFIQLCRSCHSKYDITGETIIKHRKAYFKLPLSLREKFIKNIGKNSWKSRIKKHGIKETNNQNSLAGKTRHKDKSSYNYQKKKCLKCGKQFLFKSGNQIYCGTSRIKNSGCSYEARQESQRKLKSSPRYREADRKRHRTKIITNLITAKADK